MKRLLIFPGGQPVRPDDFQLVQNEAITTSLEMIRGLCDSQTVAIVSGLKLTASGDNRSVSSGYFFDGSELCAVNGFSYTHDVSRQLYLVKSEVDDSMRRFQDNSYNKVIRERKYQLQYSTSVPSNSFRYDLVERMNNLLSINPNTLSFRQQIVEEPAYGSGFVANGSLPRPQILANGYGDVTILAQFTATTADGVLCVISSGIVPIPKPIHGYFWNGTVFKKFIWQTNGNIELVGAGTSSAVNYVQFQVNINLSFA